MKTCLKIFCRNAEHRSARYLRFGNLAAPCSALHSGGRVLIFACLLAAVSLPAQDRLNSPARRGTPARTNAVHDYSSDLATVLDSQRQALDQARQMLERVQNPVDRAAIESAIKEMERSQSALEAAAKSPDKLPAAVAAQQSAYQALLKVTPREYRVNQSRNRGQQNGNAGQPNQRQLDQLEMTTEENRYETERQAAANPTPQQREQSQVADRLKELAQRQQDLNERLRELQTALEAARTEQEREEVQRQLKRLRDEERQMLADMDELRQRVDQSANANSMSETRQQLDQARSDMQRAAQEMDRQSPSQALASGTRAQQGMQNLREDLRRQTASQFSDQMRDLRNQARELSRQQEEIARKLDSVENGEHKSLETSAERQEIAQQMIRQQSRLTNLLAGMRDVTEQSEPTEPLLSHQLYDTLRRADQMHTDNLLQMSSQLAERGFFPQAGEAERAARQNIDELRQRVERAAESVLGNEADALRYAQRELDELTRQMEREMAAAGTNAAAAGARANGTGQDSTNRLANGTGRQSPSGATGNSGTNSMTAAGSESGTNETQIAANNSQRGQPGERNATANAQRNGEQTPGQNQQNGQRGTRGGNNNGENNRSASDQQQQANNNSSRDANNPGNANPGERQQGGGAGGGADRDQLRQFAQQLGQNNRGVDRGGPITGEDFVNWSDRLRDVERVLDPQDLRNEVTMVRERAAGLRSEFRQRGRAPTPEFIQQQILTPLTQVRVWLREELARQENANNLVPLDRDPVPDNYSELVRKYYEKLGSAQ